MVYLNSALLMLALHWVFPAGAISQAGIFGLINLKGKYNMIASLLTPVLRKMFKERYRPFIYQVCQLGGLIMLVLGSVSFLGHITHEPSMYFLNWFGEDIGMALGTAIGFITGGVSIFFAVLYVDDKIDKLDQKYENRFKQLNEK